MTYDDYNTHKLADLEAMNLVDLADIGAKPADVERIKKMTTSYTQHTGDVRQSAHTGFSGLINPVLKGGRVARKWCSRIISTLQYGRMCSVLQNMRDAELDEIGISRSEIPDYAWSMIFEEKG